MMITKEEEMEVVSYLRNKKGRRGKMGGTSGGGGEDERSKRVRSEARVVV